MVAGTKASVTYIPTNFYGIIVSRRLVGTSMIILLYFKARIVRYTIIVLTAIPTTNNGLLLAILQLSKNLR